MPLALHFSMCAMVSASLGSRPPYSPMRLGPSWVEAEALAAGSAALACASLAGLRHPLRWAAAAAWLALPFVVGAPHISADPLAGFSGAAQLALRELGTQFIWATTWVSLSFWACMGLVWGAAFQRGLRPVLVASLERSRPGASTGTAVSPCPAPNEKSCWCALVPAAMTI